MIEGLIPKLDTFSKMMQYELDDPQNQEKGGWSEASPEFLMSEAVYHLGKLSKAMMSDNLDGIAEYAADTANLCMMIADRCGALRVRDLPIPTWVTIEEGRLY